MGRHPLERDFVEWRGRWWLAARARRGRGGLGPPRKIEWWGSVLTNDVRGGASFNGGGPLGVRYGEWGWWGGLAECA